MPFTIKALHMTTGNPQKVKLELLKRTKDATAYATYQLLSVTA